MNQLARFPFVRFLVAFVLGIGLGMYEIVTSLHLAIVLFTICCLLYVILVVSYKYYDNGKIWIGIVGLAAFVMAGTIRLLQDTPRLDKFHVVHCAKDVEGYQGIVVEKIAMKEYHRLTLSLERVCIAGHWQYARGKVWVSVPLGNSLRYGDEVSVAGHLDVIKGRRNPFAFDYQRFARQQGVYHQGFVSLEKVVWKRYAPLSKVMAMAYTMRTYLAEQICARIQDRDTQAVVLALVLGVRGEMDGNMRKTFSEAGIAHIFAVSGLHVGIIYAILLFFLFMLGATGYRRRWLQGLVILTVLWSYAFLTGLSASVVRAVVMFSIFTVGRLSLRHYNLWNGLSATAFGTLFYTPLWITQIGFQLSYLAVIGIGMVFPKLEQLFQPQSRLLNKLWSMIALSVSVQTACLPVSLYYFHYFPTYFLLGNAIAIPLASLMLALGLAISIIGEMPKVGSVLAWSLTKLVSTLSQYTVWLTKLPYSALGPFWPSLGEVILAYGLMMNLMIFFASKKFRYLPVATACAIGLGGQGIHKGYRQKKQEETIFYSLPKGKAVALIEGTYAFIFLDAHLQESACYTREICPSIEAMGIYKVILLPFEQGECDIGERIRYRIWKGLKVVIWKGKTIVWIDSNSLIPPSLSLPWEVDILVVDHYHTLRFMPWLRSLHPKIVVIGTALRSDKRRDLITTLRLKEIPFHDLRTAGAFML